MRHFKALLLTLALLLGTLAAPPTAMAQDKVQLKDGRSLEGTIIREEEGYIWIKVKIGGIEKEQFLTPAEIASVERSAATAMPHPAASAPKQQREPRRAGTGAPRVAIISLGENPDKSVVGLFLTADSLRNIIPALEEEQVEVVVFLVDSPGGYTYEVQRLSDVIELEYKKRFRVVAWIRSAISAAAMTSHTIEEIYFMPQGNYGAATEFSGALVATKERPLEERLAQMERISRRGKKDPAIMRSMQIMEPLSCTIDANGDVHWSNSTDGQYVVNPEGRVLTLTAEDAVKFKFARGIAASHHELARLMGYNEVEWVGSTVRGVPYPVTKAEAELRRFRDRTFLDLSRVQEYNVQYVTALNMAASRPPDERGPFLGKAQDALNKIVGMVRNNPNLGFFVLGVLPVDFRDWEEQQRERIRQLRRR
jgi:membrane-bound ClpP family serine protease